MNDTVCFANGTACAQQASPTLHPLAFDSGAGKYERLAYLWNVHAFVEYAFCGQDLYLTILKRLDDTLRLIATSRLFRCELMKQDILISQKPVYVVELLRSFVRRVDQRVFEAAYIFLIQKRLQHRNFIRCSFK